MSILEFLFVSCFYFLLFLLIKRNQLEETLKNLALFLLQRKEIQALLLFSKWFQARSPVIKKEVGVLSVTFLEKGKLYTIYVPYDRRQRTDREYVIEKGDVKSKFLLPAGVKLCCTKEDFRADDLREITEK